MRYLFLTLFLASVLAWPISASKAQEIRCLPRKTLEYRLHEKFHETKFLASIDSAGSLFQIFYNPETGTWTVTVTRPNGGISCVISSGDSFIHLWTPEIETQESQL